MYELFIANKNYSSWSLRPWILMRQLTIPFAERAVLFTEDSSYDAFPPILAHRPGALPVR